MLENPELYHLRSLLQTTPNLVHFKLFTVGGIYALFQLQFTFKIYKKTPSNIEYRMDLDSVYSLPVCKIFRC